MAEQYNTSFIPKKFLTQDVAGGGSSSRYVKRRSVMGPGYFLALLIFVIAILGSIGVFFYARIVEGEIASIISDLEQRKESIRVADVQEYLRLDKRLKQAALLLNQHVAPSEMIKALEQETLTTVRYDSLTYEGEAGASSIDVTLSGEARDYQSVAFQADQFTDSQYFLLPEVTQLARSTENGNASFGLVVRVDPVLINYNAAIRDGRHGAGGFSTLRTTAPAPVVPEPVFEEVPEAGPVDEGAPPAPPAPVTP